MRFFPDANICKLFYKYSILHEKFTIYCIKILPTGFSLPIGSIASIKDVLDNVRSEKMKKLLSDCKAAHEDLGCQVQTLLYKYQDDGKEPNPIAKSMSWMKSNMKLAMDESDGTVADLITDGCNMGVKSLNRYLNQYKAADEKSKDITKRLINLEEKLAIDLRDYL